MRKLEFYLLDVFAENRFEGNQLAVFTDASNPDVSQMQLIAKEMNLSETTFITGTHKDQSGSLVYDTRIFTIVEELPFEVTLHLEPHPFYQAWEILSVALYVVVSGISYFVFLNLRIKRGTFP